MNHYPFICLRAVSASSRARNWMKPNPLLMLVPVSRIIYPESEGMLLPWLRRTTGTFL